MVFTIMQLGEWLAAEGVEKRKNKKNTFALPQPYNDLEDPYKTL